MTGVKGNARKAKLSPANRARYINLSRKRIQLIKLYTQLYMRWGAGNHSNQLAQYIEKINKNLKNLIEERNRNFSYERGLNINDEIMAELESRRPRIAAAVSHVANERERHKYYRAVRNAEKMWNNVEKYGRTNANLLYSAKNKSRLHTAKSASPVSRKVSPPPRSAKSANSSPSSKRQKYSPETLGRFLAIENNRRRNQILGRAGFPRGGFHSAKTWARNARGRVFIRGHTSSPRHPRNAGPPPQRASSGH